MGSGERFDSRPEIDVAGAINAASQAFRNSREGVLNKAIALHRIQQEQQQSAREDQAQELQMRNAGWRPPEEVASGVQASPVTPLAPIGPSSNVSGDPSQGGGAPAGPIVNPAGGGGAQIAPPSPTATDGVAPPPIAQAAPTPQPQTPVTQPLPAPVTFGGTGKYSNWVQGIPASVQRGMDLRGHALQTMAQIDPTMFTPAEIEMGKSDPKVYDQLVARADKVRQTKADAKDRYDSLEGATGLDGKTPLSEAQRRALSVDPLLYRKYQSDILNPPRDPVAIHKADRDYDITHPTKGESTASDAREEGRVQTWVQGRIKALTAPKSDGMGGKTEGMDFDAARAQALSEAPKLFSPHTVSRLYPDATPPAHSEGGTEGSGNIDLSGGGDPMAAHRQIDRNMEAAIAAGADPAKAAERANQLHAQLLHH